MKTCAGPAMMLLASQWLAGCGPASDVGARAPAFPDSLDAPPPGDASRRLFVYDCGPGSAFIVRVGADSVWIDLPARVVALPHVPSASGARYSSSANTFWSKGDSALIEIGTLQYPACAGRAASNIWEAVRLSGVDFRAVGNEPGWYADIHDDEMIVVVADYGERRAVTPAPSPEVDAASGRTTYRVRTEAHAVSIVIYDEPCADVMSGEPFPARVTLTLDGQEYTGCGRPLR